MSIISQAAQTLQRFAHSEVEMLVGRDVLTSLASALS